MRFRLGALLVVLLLPVSLSAQTLDLRDLLTLSLVNGITLADPPPGAAVNHRAHFIGADSPQLAALQQFNQRFATQLSSFPLASSAGGFSYNFDPALGVLTRAADSFGPVYAERAETMGRGKFNVGFNVTHFTFEHLDGIDLRGGGVQLVFTHGDVNHDNNNFFPYVEGDVITANMSIKAESDVRTLAMSYGANDRLDLGLAIPLVDVKIDSLTNLQVRRLATGESSIIHRFVNGTANDVLRLKGSASGIGDVVLRGKFRAFSSPRGGVAFATDLRLPTGQSRDLLGTGATQVKGVVIGSMKFGHFAPHINAGYAVSTKANGVKLPNEISLTTGFDVALHPRLTFAADILGRRLLKANAVSVQNATFRANTNPDATTAPVVVETQLPRLISQVEDTDVTTGSIGIKVNPFGNVLLTINGLFSLNNKGLQSRFAPTVALDYSF